MKSLKQTLKKLEKKVSDLELSFRKELYTDKCSLFDYVEIWDMLDGLKQSLARALSLLQKINDKNEGLCKDEEHTNTPESTN